MINCQDLVFNLRLSQQRINKTESILGNSTFSRIMCYSLYNLGVNRENISKALNMPAGTVRSTIRAINRGGPAAFDDRRKKPPTVVSTPLPQTQKATVNIEETSTIITIAGNEIKIPKSNPLQTKVFLLTLLDNGMLRNTELADILNVSKAQVSNLSKRLRDSDVLCLIDKRQGQQKDYVFTENVISELIQQYIANIVTKRSTSSGTISKQVNEVCNTEISDRATRQHVSKLGLSKIKQTLPGLLVKLKKTSKG